jgi:hypothetical protein
VDSESDSIIAGAKFAFTEWKKEIGKNDIETRKL